MAQRNRNVRAFTAGLTYALIAALCVLAVMAVQHRTADTIAAHRDAEEQAMLRTMLPEASKTAQGELSFTCKLLSDKRIGKNMPAYIVRDAKGDTMGLIATYSTSKGYSNPLVLMAGIDNEGKVAHVDVKLSRETPGIGDKIEYRRGDYLDMFKGLGLEDASWEVRKFNGDFDYITGATVTSRAVVLATADLLRALRDGPPPELLPDCDKH